MRLAAGLAVVVLALATAGATFYCLVSLLVAAVRGERWRPWARDAVVWMGVTWGLNLIGMLLIPG